MFELVNTLRPKCSQNWSYIESEYVRNYIQYTISKPINRGSIQIRAMSDGVSSQNRMDMLVKRVWIVECL